MHQLEGRPPNFHYTEDNQHYATFSNQQFAQCKGSTTMFCDSNIALTASASSNCLSAIFFNQKDSVTDLRDFRFKTNVLPTAMFELSPLHLLLYKTTMLATNS